MGRKRVKEEEQEKAVVPAAKQAAKAAAPSARIGRKKAVSDYVCGFCGCSYSEVDEWGSTPVACFACEDRALLLRPSSPVAVLLRLYKEPSEDGGCFKGEFDEATEDDSSFQPKSTVEAKEVYGYQIFQGYALLSDAELGPLLGSLPTKKKQKDVTVPWLGPESACHFNLVDLSELTYQASVGLRKARLFFESSSQRSKIFLKPETQLVEAQGDHVFKHVADACIAARPAGLTPSAARPKTVSQLKEDIAQMELDLEAAAAPEEKDKDDDVFEEADQPDVGKTGKKRPAGIGFVAPVPKKASKNKGGGKGSKTPSTSTAPAGAPAAPLQPAQAGLSAATASNSKVETRSQSTAGGAKGKALLGKFEGDEDMKTVAEFQLSCNSHAPLKSLEGLVPVDFLLGEKDQKTLNNIVNGAKKIMETLEKKGQQHELNLLETRVELCEHALALGYSNLSVMKHTAMQAHVMKTKTLWGKYPVSLQLGIVTRHVLQSLEQMAVSKKKGSESWKEPALEFVTFFRLDVAEMLTADPSSCETSFEGHAPTWQTGLMNMILAAGELAEDSLSSIKLDDEDGAMTAEAAQVKTAELRSIATDFASKLRGLFTHPCWSELLNLQEKASDVHIYVCKHLYKHIDAMSSLFASWIDTPLVPIAEAFEQILSMAKAILHLHAWDPASEADTDSLKPTEASDVFDFLKCDKQFERSLSKTLQDGWWKTEIADIAKTAGSRPLVQAQWRELNDLLQEMAPEQATAQHLSRITELFETVGKGMRGREMHRVSCMCKDLVVAVARNLMQSEPAAVDMSQLSKQADVVTSLLRRFGQEPEIPTLLDDFAAWLQGSTSQRQLAMLISAMEECARGSIDFKKIKQLVPGVGKDQSYTVAEDQAAKFNQAACNFIFKGLLTVSDQVNSPAADEAACTQRAADVRLNLAIVSGVAKLVKDFVTKHSAGRDAFNAYINACISLSLAAVFHAKEINLLENFGPDAETRNIEDLNAKRLRQAKSAKVKCVSSENTLSAAQQKLLPFIEAEDGSSLHGLVTFKLGECFHYHNNEVYQDCVLHLLSLSERELTKSSGSVVERCLDRHEGGKEWWRRDLPKNAALNDVLQTAAGKIKGVDGNQLKKDLEAMAKDIEKVQADIKFFDDGDCPDIKKKCDRVTELVSELCAGGLKQAKAFTMEVLLLLVLGRLKKDATDANKETVRNLVTHYNVQFASNCFGVTADDLHPQMWQEATAV